MFIWTLTYHLTDLLELETTDLMAAGGLFWRSKSEASKENYEPCFCCITTDTVITAK